MKQDDFRVGIGYDIHPLERGRDLVLGGVTIEHEMGLAGHSDADVLCHALCDALLGAVNLGDIGRHFPETEDYLGISSILLLERVGKMAADKGFRLINADCIINAESPRLAGRTAEMSQKIASALQAGTERISIKCTRGEGMGPVGERRAMEARAVVLMASDG
ncbi:MAG: 2-C-methyl-D-erythritol 2,4-cyclodiphosphate synthase [Candidatus Latescibacteria bacterium]|nr:2-C-methyl-D-erythritol 2,4-cyclodiphosphate synthase [bacterium]MBD3423494.1 2-C-methyl-D-erythritol 2,4-cyclodiphosphate synthase [Candidatus Latescibacterota bacterium]